MKKSVQSAVIILSGMAISLGIAGCGTDSGKDKTGLEFVDTGKATLTVGETSPRWAVSKTFVDPNGRTATTNPYTYFTLTSSDTDVARVVNTQYLLAKKTGTTLITASDDKNNTLSTETSARITVIAP